MIKSQITKEKERMGETYLAFEYFSIEMLATFVGRHMHEEKFPLL